MLSLLNLFLLHANLPVFPLCNTLLYYCFLLSSPLLSSLLLSCPLLSFPLLSPSLISLRPVLCSCLLCDCPVQEIISLHIRLHITHTIKKIITCSRAHCLWLVAWVRSELISLNQHLKQGSGGWGRVHVCWHFHYNTSLKVPASIRFKFQPQGIEATQRTLVLNTK